MHTLVIKTELTPPNAFERLAGMRFVYATTSGSDIGLGFTELPLMMAKSVMARMELAHQDRLVAVVFL
jgi:hypothetical protein